MARYTISEFTEVVGLGKDRDSVIRSGIILKALCGIGVAREAGKKQGSNGRPALVYEVQDPIVIPLGLAKAALKAQAPAVQVPVAEPEPAPAAPAPVAVGYYDDDEDD